MFTQVHENGNKTRTEFSKIFQTEVLCSNMCLERDFKSSSSIHKILYKRLFI